MPAIIKEEKKPGGWNFSLHNMRLQTRLVLLTLGISIPLIMLSIWILTTRAEGLLMQQVSERLAQANNALFMKTDTWLTMNINVLHQLASLDDINSMDAARQKPVLAKTAKAFPYMFLVQTLNLSGFNVARNDDQANKDYSDRTYFQGARAGEQVSYQVLISRTNNQPALNMAAPIKNDTGKIIGVMSVALELKDITQEVLETNTGGTKNEMVTFIVDRTDKVIAHPDEKVAANLTDFHTYPPVAALRQGQRGIFEFTDAQGHHWLAFLTQMENGWGIITQEDYAAAFAPVTQFRLISALIVSIAGVLLAVFALVTIRRSLRPVIELTETVAAVTAGDFSQVARVERNDEVGKLAEAFNTMTAQLRDNITNLEQRIQERTRALTLSSEVSHRLTTILDMNQLTGEVVDQLQQAFHYYHVHIYLFDETGENLIMAGGTGEAGQVMQARGHRIQAGKGLVGRAAETNRPVLVRKTNVDPDWLPNPLLPETKSELAVPIATGDQVLGVLDVQQNIADGLSQEDVDLIQSVANQVAVALQNARAYARTQQRAEREALVVALGQKIQQATTIDEVLKVAVSGLGQALGAQRSSVELRSSAIGGTNSLPEDSRTGERYG